jgi:hypothetical protein
MDTEYWMEVLRQLKRYGGDEVCINIAQKKLNELEKKEAIKEYK